jgi:hypothetical protein
MHRRDVVTGAFALLLALAPTSARAQGRSGRSSTGRANVTRAPRINPFGEQDRARRAVETRSALPLAEVLRRIGSQLNGRVIDAALIEVGGSLIYRLKVLSADGRTVRIVEYNASTGAMVRGS